MTQINDLYASEYISLTNVDELSSTTNFWWSSRERRTIEDGNRTSEYLEIDFGRKRAVNYMSFDISRKPIEISIYYDAWSFSDGRHYWVEVTPMTEFTGMHEAYENSISFAPNLSDWQNAEFYFLNADGNPVVTKNILIEFRRKNVAWPTDATTGFPWSIDVQNLRTSRIATKIQDVENIVIETDITNDELDVDTFIEAIQYFELPDDYARGGLSPDISGVGMLFNVTSVGNYVVNFQLLDGTDSLLGAKQVTGTPYAGGLMWIDAIFETPASVTNGPFKIIVSTNSTSITSIATQSPIVSPTGDTADTPLFIREHVGNLIETNEVTDTNAAFRVWGAIGESGKDILGNYYREGARRNKAANVIDGLANTHWLSSPAPSPKAVECLYFDIRQLDDTVLVPSVIDSILVNPSFPGPYMHVYYSNEGGLAGTEAPKKIADWERLRWTPVNQTFILDKSRIFTLPRPIRACYICLEFSRLQPIPFRIPERPAVPSVSYKEYPTWVQDIFSTNEAKTGLIASNVNPSNTVPVAQNLLDSYKAYGEFIYQQRLEKPEGTSINASVTQQSSVFDVQTLAQIFFPGTNMFQSALPYAPSTTKRYVEYTPQFGTYVSTEATRVQRFISDFVSNVNNRMAQSANEMFSIPMWFNQECRHGYKELRAQFNGKGYMVGIKEVKFIRKDYTVRQDWEEIHDSLLDSSSIPGRPATSPFVEVNTWQADIPSSITDGQTLYVSYRVNEQDYNDEEVILSSFSSAPLSAGGAKAINIRVFSHPNKAGVEYMMGYDFDADYDGDLERNYIRRTSLHYRLVAS